ncbi:MAG: hypothetical protein V7642_1514 [Burkholderiales bacterium]
MPWRRIHAVALCALMTVAVAMEVQLGRMGFVSAVQDSQERWEKERLRASRLGNKALILVGASRIQLGVDLDILRKETGLEPVQLAIDGSAFTPVLAGLAADPAIRGTIIVDYYDHAVGVRGGTAETYQRDFESHGAGKTALSPYLESEKFLTEWIREHLLSYADGANPFNSLFIRILNDDGARLVLTTLPDRSRLGDYSRVRMPDYYYRRVARTLGLDEKTFASSTESSLKKLVESQTSENNAEFVRNTRILKQLVSRIESRGGKVSFLAMPSGGMVREIEERRYPREKFWDPFVKEMGAPAVRSVDHPLLKEFTCPDGSHLDFRDRAEFTMAMTHALGLNRRTKSVQGANL